MIIRHFGIVKNGAFVPHNLEKIQENLKGLEGKEIYVTFSREDTSRSVSQLGYYFGAVLQPIADEIGYDKKEAHETLKNHFGIKSLKDLDSKELTQYITRVRIFAGTEFGVNIPEPGGYE